MHDYVCIVWLGSIADKINDEYSEIIESLKTARATTKSKSGPIDSSTAKNLIRLNHWAMIRHNYRIRNGALDEYLRHKTGYEFNAYTN